MKYRMLPEAARLSRVPRVQRGDGRTILVALLLFAIMALIAAIFTAVIPVPLVDRGAHTGQISVTVPAPQLVRGH